MLETPHAIVGVAIAAKVGNPLLAVPLAFSSHFVLDMIPHWNPHINTELKKYGSITKRSKAIIFVDLALAGVSTLVLTSQISSVSPYILLVAGFAGMLPDIIEAPYFFFKYKTKALMLWLKFQKSIQVDVDVVPGTITQVAIVLASIWWIFS